MSAIKLNSIQTDNLDTDQDFIYLMIPKKDLKLYSSAAPPDNIP